MGTRTAAKPRKALSRTRRTAGGAGQPSNGNTLDKVQPKGRIVPGRSLVHSQPLRSRPAGRAGALAVCIIDACELRLTLASQAVRASTPAVHDRGSTVRHAACGGSSRSGG